uniref:50S ribosomal protein L31 n=1 Tax=Bangia fuscopurpurea TaxID=101920 RepID=A0A0F6VXJ2_BANFU|nr:50S ribosomal protein L31 [Bangia fuscopurpurea]
MAKENIHPNWYPDAKVYCDGELIMTIGSTKPELHVDIWSGNHPFFTGSQRLLIRKVELRDLCVNIKCIKINSYTNSNLQNFY